MKKTALVSAFLFTLVGIFAQETGTLDGVIEQAAKYVEGSLKPGTKVAVLNFSSASEGFSDYVVEEVTGFLVRGKKVTIVDRKNLALIRKEMDLQLSGDISDESAQAIGRQLGAQSIVSGSLTNLGSRYRFRIKVIHVESAAIEGQASYNVQNDEQMTFLLTGKRQPGAESAPAPASAEKVYKIGDKGPAGGIVFFDKGYFGDGWQYLEAASRDIGVGIPWSASMRIISGTSTAVGRGKRNTELIIASGETISAALVASHYSQGGYKDWYLPSKDELNLMYRNLKQRNLGGFSNGWYWSSSDAYTPKSDNDGWRQLFSNGKLIGSHNGDNKNATDSSVRPIRQF